MCVSVSRDERVVRGESAFVMLSLDDRVLISSKSRRESVFVASRCERRESFFTKSRRECVLFLVSSDKRESAFVIVSSGESVLLLY